MIMKSSTRRLILGLLDPLLRTFGTSNSFVQLPALMVRRFVLLAVFAVGSLVVLFVGLSLLLSGLLELSAYLGATWIFSLAVGSLVAILGAVGLSLSLRQHAWTRPIEDTRASQGPHPLEAVLTIALEMLEERKAQKLAQEEAERAAEESLGRRPLHREAPSEAPWTVN